MSAFQSPSRRGFTLIELLVVVALIGILVALLLPAVQQAREAMRRASCQNNLKQLGVALHNYHDRVRVFPFGWDTHGTGWSAMILPELEQQSLFDTIVFSESANWGSTSNQDAAGTLVPVSRCPSLVQPEHVDNDGIPRRVPVSYRGCGASDVMTDDAGTAPPGFRSFQELEHNGIFYGCSHVALRDILDGTSTTILLGESYTDVDFIQDGNAMDYWFLGSPQIDPCRCDGSAAGTEFTEFVGSTAARLNARWIASSSGYEKEMSFGSYHAGGAYFCFADGSVRFIAEGVDHSLYRALGSRHGSEVIGRF
jgi:prepilin-type N-terminal cleavage/methylation domain-containing protein/prepilin-type processing-associated H-X9-DG protein